MTTWKPVANVLGVDARSASASGTQLLGMGVSIGLISAAGVAMGALCPLCVVAAPAFLGAGALQKARAFVLARRAPKHPGGIDPETHHRELVADGALLLDVRSPSEFNRGHPAVAVNIPLDELEARIGDVGPLDRPVVVYSEGGTRSGLARSLLARAGFQVRDLGPVAAW